MGREAACVVRWGRRASKGRALLESQELLFRGDFRLKIPFKGITSLVAKDGVLTVRFAGGTAAFELGEQAAKWAERIRKPKGLLDKLGVKSGMRVSVMGVDDAAFRKQLWERTEEVSQGRVASGSDLVFLGASVRADLERLRALKSALAPRGAIWVVWPKGRQEIKEDHVRAAALPLGLVDVKVASFSETSSALKLVVRKSGRS